MDKRRRNDTQLFVKWGPGIIHLLAAEPLITAGPIFPSHSLWNDLADRIYGGVGLAGWRAGSIIFYWPMLLYLFLTSTIFHFLLFLSIGWYCGPGVFELIGCKSLSPSLALPTTFNNNNIRNYFVFVQSMHTSRKDMTIPCSSDRMTNIVKEISSTWRWK